MGQRRGEKRSGIDCTEWTVIGVLAWIYIQCPLVVVEFGYNCRGSSVMSVSVR